jgi:Zn-dependent M28 family amino/carboxypeptidase
MRKLVVVAALAACGGGGENPGDDTVIEDGPAIDARRIDAEVPPDAGACVAIDGCEDLFAYQREIVAKLTGEMEIAPDVTINRRASAAERSIVRDYLVEELERWGYTPVLHEYSASGANVVATLPATRGSEDAIIILGGHFDTVQASPGAADNATGTSLVLAAARYFATVPERTHELRFVLFDQEEIGLIGSGQYAEQLLDDATPVAAMHNFDMISYDGDGDRAIELWSPAPALETAYREVALPLGIPIHPFTFPSSDHQSFVSRGFTAVGVSEEYEGNDSTDHYHQPTDTYNRIDFAHLGRVTEVAITVVERSITP